MDEGNRIDPVSGVSFRKRMSCKFGWRAPETNEQKSGSGISEPLRDFMYDGRVGSNLNGSEFLPNWSNELLFN